MLFSLHAVSAQMWLLLNNSSDSRNSSGDVDLHILAVLQQLAAPELQISPLRLGDARTWLLLQKPGNYCALSKIRTPERAGFFAFFRQAQLCVSTTAIGQQSAIGRKPG